MENTHIVCPSRAPLSVPGVAVDFTLAKGAATDRAGLDPIPPVYAIIVSNAASIGAILSVLPVLLLDLGTTPLVLGIMVGVEAFNRFVAASPLAKLSDRYGRKTVLLASQIGAFISPALLGVGQTMLFVLEARILLGLTPASSYAAATYTADNSTPANRKQPIGILSAGLGIGRIVGPSFGKSLSENSLSAPIWAAIALSFISVFVTRLFIKGPRAPRQYSEDTDRDEAGQDRIGLRSLLDPPVIRIFVIVLLCHYFALGLFSSKLAVFLGDTYVSDGHAFAPRELGYLLIVNIVVQLMLLHWRGRWFTGRSLVVLLLWLG